MTSPVVHTTRHAVVVAAPPDTVYALIADVGEWPHTFSPTVHVQRLDSAGHAELLRLWATANGEVRTWTSRRELDPAARRIAFRQQVSSPPVLGMGGEWLISERGPDTSEVVLLHDFSVEDDDPAKVSWVRAAIDRNSDAELAALRAAAELGPARAELVLSFEDSVIVHGSAAEVYEVLYRADAWPQRLPHVSRLVLQEDTPGVQWLDMDTRSRDGSVHTTRSIRICFPSERIVYKQTGTPPIMSAHTGQWRLSEHDGGEHDGGEHDGVVRATSQHTVVLRPEKLTDVLGAGATVQTARDLVRRALGANSLATLGVAKQIVESARV